MEYNDYPLDSFSSSMIQYLNQILIKENCVSHSFRKNRVKNEKDIEFSLILKSAINPSLQGQSSYLTDSSCLTEEDLNRLKVVSTLWSLHLSEALLRGSKLLLKLNKPQAYLSVINAILSKKAEYGKNSFNNQVVKVTWESANGEYLTEHRLVLVKKAVENCLTAAGYRLSNSSGFKWIHHSTRSGREAGNGDEPPRLFQVIVCGPVLNSLTRAKETGMTIEDYRRARHRDFEILSEGKNCDQNSVNVLTDAAIKISFLQVKATQAIFLNLDSEFAKNRETGSKGGTFLLYNLSRLAAIRNKYLKGIEIGLYSPLPPAETVDFSVLTQAEEWCILFNFLLEYPSLIKRCAQAIVTGTPGIHQICKFLLSLCSLFSVYYRKDRILLDSKPHLLPLLQARIHLAMAIEQVLENGLTLLDIGKVESM